MVRASVLLLFVGPALLGGWCPAPTLASPERLPTSASAVDAAIEHAADYVIGEQKTGGAWGTGKRAVGHTALVVLALLHAGVEEDAGGPAAASLARGTRFLDHQGPGLTAAGDRGAQVYDTALLLLVERARGRSSRPRMRRLVDVLQRSQAANGQWSYELPRGSRHQLDAGDNSNTQFAILGLGAAVGEGVRVDTQVLRRARSWWLGASQSDGGFGYSSGGSLASASTGSMTAAGISSLAILDAAFGGRATHGADPATRSIEVVERAIERLGAGFSVTHNFGPAQGAARQRQRNAGRGWLHYYLWSVERAMVLAGRERLSDRDWFAEGTQHLLSTQKRDGSWRGERPLYATCFALLFLTRAADPPRVFTPPDLPSGTLTPGDETPQPEPASNRLPGEVDDWLKAGTPAADLARACLDTGPRSLGPLVGALGHPRADVRRRANAVLRQLLGDERVGRADHHPLARGRLRLWVRRFQRHLRVEDGRFVLP